MRSPDKQLPDTKQSVAEARQAIEALIRDVLSAREVVQAPASLPLVVDTIGVDEVMAVIDTLLDRHITMGPRVRELEAAWTSWLFDDSALTGDSASTGRSAKPASLMVNSGSSANLIGVAAFASPEVDGGLRPGDEILVPAVSWSTSVYPILQAGCRPVFVDVDPDTLNLDAANCEAALSDRTRGILLIHLLGNPCSMHDLVDLCTRKNLFLFEDCCEAHGAEFQGQKVGTFGDMSSFSFYFSHHMTTGEGGMLSIRDESRFADIARSLRAHGWVRERSDRQVFLDANPELDPRWLFVSQGYNVRSMDLNAAIGLVQLRRLSAWVEDRVRIRAAMAAALEPYADRLRFQRVTEDGLHSGFGFSMILRPEAGLDRKRFMASLESRGIECRPLVGGNMARQPVARHLDARIAGTLSGADLAHDHGLMIGIHASVTDAQIEHLASAVGRALQENG